MEPAFIRTEGGEELVVLSRHAYDALLARAGDEAAEDRATARLVDDHLAAREGNHLEMAPSWLTDGLLDGHSAITAARLRAGLNQADLADASGIAQDELDDLEQGRRRGAAHVMTRIAAATGVEARWLLIAREAAE